MEIRLNYNKSSHYGILPMDCTKIIINSAEFINTNTDTFLIKVKSSNIIFVPQKRIIQDMDFKSSYNTERLTFNFNKEFDSYAIHMETDYSNTAETGELIINLSFG